MNEATDYAALTDDALFAALQNAAIQENESAESYASDPQWMQKQQHWATQEARIKQEIAQRGDHLQGRYLELLGADEPRVRLSAALAVRKFAPLIAAPILAELHDSAKYGIIAATAGSTLRAMRDRGDIPQQ